MSQQPKAAATQEQPPVASTDGGRSAQQGQKPSTGASAGKTSNPNAPSDSKANTTNGGANLSWAARLAQANGGAKQQQPPEEKSSTESSSAATQPAASQQRQSSSSSSRSSATTGVKLPVGVSTAAGKDISFGSFDPSELQQPQQQKDSGSKTASKGSFAAAASNKQHQPPPAPPTTAPIATGQQQQQRPYSGGQSGRPHRAAQVQAVIPPSGSSYQQSFVSVQPMYGGQPYVPPYMQSPSAGFYAGGFQPQYQAGGYYGNQAQSPSVSSGTPTGQAAAVTGPSGATQYGSSTPSSPLPVKPPAQPPRQKRILRIENPDTHEVLNLDAVASEVSKQEKEEKATAAAAASAATDGTDAAAVEDGKDGKSFKDAMLAAVAAAAGKAEEPAKVEEEPKTQQVEAPKAEEEKPAAPEEPVASEESTTAPASTPFATEEVQSAPLGDEPDMSSGRKRYSKQFLLGFRDMEICRSLPPAIEVATLSALAFTGDRQDRHPHQAGNDRDWKSNRAPSGGPPGMRGGRQGSGRMRGPAGIDADTWERGKALPPMPGVGYGGRGPPPGMRMPTGPLPALHKSESAYKMGRVTTDDPEEEKAQKALKSMLNKITPQNFAKITAQIIDKINERKKAKTLQGFIDQIFDKALTETTFAELYADLVSKLNPALPSLEDEEGNPVQFRRTLLNKCQEEFETGSLAMKAVAEREKREQSGEGAEEQEEEEPEELEEGEITDVEKEKRDAAAEAKRQDKEAAEAEVKARKRMLGNIIFVGQLYRFGVLTESIMHTCIQTLLTETEHPRPEDVECLCKLLATVGRSMDSSERVVKAGGDEGKNATTKEMMGAYFRRIEALMKNEALDSRHRFMLADLVDLRKNNWVQRRKAEGPKKIEDIHRDAAMERSRSQMLDRQMSRSRSDLRQARPPYDNRVDAPIRTLNRVGSQDSFNGQGQSFRPGGRPPPPSRPAPPPPDRPSTPSPDEESEKPAAGPVNVEQKVKGMLEEMFNGGDDFTESTLSVQELLDAGTEDKEIVEQCFSVSLEMKGTDWDKFSAFLVQASDSLPVSAMEEGSRQLLNKLDDLSVDVPKAPLQIGKVIANLIAANRLPSLAIMAKHIKEADAEPEEGEEPLAIGSGVAAKVLGSLLQSLKTLEFDVSGAWKESGFAVAEFLPEENRNDEGVEEFASTYEIADVLSA